MYNIYNSSSVLSYQGLVDPPVTGLAGGKVGLSGGEGQTLIRLMLATNTFLYVLIIGCDLFFSWLRLKAHFLRDDDDQQLPLGAGGGGADRRPAWLIAAAPSGAVTLSQDIAPQLETSHFSVDPNSTAQIGAP